MIKICKFLSSMCHFSSGESPLLHSSSSDTSQLISCMVHQWLTKVQEVESFLSQEFLSCKLGHKWQFSIFAYLIRLNGTRFFPIPIFILIFLFSNYLEEIVRNNLYSQMGGQILITLRPLEICSFVKISKHFSHPQRTSAILKGFHGPLCWKFHFGISSNY